MVTITVKTEEEGKGKGKGGGIPWLAQDKKKRGNAAEKAMSADHVDTTWRYIGSDTNGDMGMEESYSAGWAVPALVPFAKGRDPDTVGGKLQESSRYGQQDVTAGEGKYHYRYWLVAGLVCWQHCTCEQRGLPSTLPTRRTPRHPIWRPRHCLARWCHCWSYME